MTTSIIQASPAGAAGIGAAVAPAGRDEQAIGSAVEEIRAAGSQALAIPTDLADPASVERLCSDQASFITAPHPDRRQEAFGGT